MTFDERVKAILLEEFVRARARNPSYSMRAYALRVGVAQSVISQVLGGKRPLTVKTARRLLEGLHRDPAEIREILRSAEGDEGAYAELSLDAFYLVADWYHYAILSLAQTESFRGTPEWIADRLGLSVKTAEEALHRLLRTELLRREGKRVVPTGLTFSAISATPHLALRKANQENLQLAERALAEVPVENRDFTAITLCFDPDRMEEARQLIRNFRRKFDRIMESGRRREVYKLCVQLFPLSKTVH